MEEDLIFGLVVDPSGMVKGVKVGEDLLDKLGGGLDDVEDKAKKTGDVFKIALGNTIANAVSTAGRAVSNFARNAIGVLNESVQLAGIQQIAERKLDQALLNLGDASAESRDQLKQLAGELQGVSNFGDEATITAQAMLLSFGEVSGAQGAALLTPRLADVAAGIQSVTGEATDLNTVATALGKALTTGSGALSRYGISLSATQKAAFDTSDGLERVQILTEILDSNFQGLAAATVDPLVQAENAVGDLQEALGSDLRPEIENLARQFTDFVSDQRTVDFAKQVGDTIISIGEGVIRFFQFSIPIATNRLKASMADTVANIIDGAGSIVSFITDPFAGLEGRSRTNPFESTVTGYRQVATAARFTTDELLNQEIQQSANRMLAELQAEELKNLADQQAILAAETRAANQAEAEAIALAEARNQLLQARTEEAERARKAANTDEILDAGPLDLGEPLEVFDAGSLAAVDEAIAQLQSKLQTVSTQEARTELQLMIAELNGVRDEMMGVQETFELTVDGSINSLEDLVNSVINAAIKVVQAKLAEAIAGAVGFEFLSKGLLGAVTAAAAAGAVSLAFNRLVRPLLPSANIRSPGGSGAGSSSTSGGGRRTPVAGTPRPVVFQNQQAPIVIQIQDSEQFTPAGDRIRQIRAALLTEQKSGGPGTLEVSS